MTVNFGWHDLALVVAVSIQATLLAELREPRWKAAMLSLPIPFTMATLALGKPVSASHVLGLPILYLYAHSVRLLHLEWRVPIVPAIILGAAGYLLIASMLAGVIPNTDASFWTACIVTFALGVTLLKLTPRRNEPAHRSPLPVWIKWPIIATVIVLLVTIKNTLQGFMTLFPMMGVVAAYEARHSLWTICRQMPVVMMTLTPMMAACRLSQEHIGLYGALIVGWLTFLAVFLPFTRNDWKQHALTSNA